jgi:F-type H+-transporting ATPase subunit gamma
MAGAKEIRGKIKSIQNTQKITKAMQMVAASKMRKCQDRMLAARPYAERIRKVVAHLVHAQPEYRHAYLVERPVKRVGYIIVSTDRGLCGGLNINLFKEVVKSMRQWNTQGVQIDVATIGSKATGFFRRYGGNLVAHAERLGDNPRMEDLIGTVKVMLDAYDDGKIDRVYIARNEFINTMAQRPQVLQLLPAIDDVGGEVPTKYWDYIYEPDASELLNVLFERYVEARVYRSVVENISCEMAARMVAMKSATDNAGNLISELQLIYNKARQASITQELAEIVGGAAAV